MDTQQQAPAGVSALRWSDPFERLAVGQRFEGGERTVRETDVCMFCALTGDRHPQHWDAEWAQSSAFGERIAHGLLVVSLAVGLAPLDPGRVLALRRLSDVVFKRPVRLGETISLCGEVTCLAPLDERAGLTELTWAIRNQDRALVCRAKVQLLWRCDAAPAGDAAPFWHDAMLGGTPQQGFRPLPL